MLELNSFLEVNDEVHDALAAAAPIVAFESTIISHGMPYPDNIETALKLASTAREQGAVPATIAIIDGKIRVGLSEEQIHGLAKEKCIVKTSRRDIPFVVAKGMSGATTVAATMLVAKMAGIKVFATGGIGGVHRGAEKNMDISADLEELSRTDVAVVCAGPKSILDIGLTLEYLETKGVPVIGYRTDKLPAFYCAESDYDVDYRCDSAAEIAQTLKVKSDLGLQNGVVIANPIPQKHALSYELMNEIIQQAFSDAERKGIYGKNITPFLLERVNELSGGDSLTANIALVLNNTKLAAQIAVLAVS